MDVSVIICTHNPRPDYLERTLNALKHQSLPKNQWELILIDNASKEPLTGKWDLSWHPDARIIREEELGLTPARLRGIREAKTELLVFVDDDNILAGDYLNNAFKLSISRPWVGAFSGNVVGEFETEPDKYVKSIIHELSDLWVQQESWGFGPGMKAIDFCPIGAGLVVRRKIGIYYMDLLKRDPLRRGLGRKGSSLVSCEDTDMGLCACSIGFAVGRFPQLDLVHLIPSRRLDRDYIMRLIEDKALSFSLLNFIWEGRLLAGKKPRLIKRLLRPIRKILSDRRGFKDDLEFAHARGRLKTYEMIPSQKKRGPFQKLGNSIRKRTRPLYYKFKAEFILPGKRAKKKNKPFQIEAITMMYNEALLAPLFVCHYAPWVDKFTVFYSKSIDGTRRELEAAAAKWGANLEIVPIEFPDGFDDRLKIKALNEALRKSSADFVVCVDADEFVYPWPFDQADPRRELAKETANVIRCEMFQVYRHLTDKDIDANIPPLFQRRHGIPDGRQQLYCKPCIVRPDSGVDFEVGCHHVTLPYPESRRTWRGVHWGKADDFCLERYLRDRRDRLSKENRLRGNGVELFDITAERLDAELKAHATDPELF